MGVAIWSSVPLTLRIFVNLKSHRGLYFWAMLVTSWGICIRSLGYILLLEVPSSPWGLSISMVQDGWVMMVSGFAVILYSRLNIILENWKIQRALLTMIIIIGCVFHPLMITLSIGNSWFAAHIPQSLPNLLRSNKVSIPAERIQIIAFSLQEMIISSFYIRAAYQYLRGRFLQQDRVRKAMFVLLSIQAIVFLLDIGLVVIDEMGLTTVKLVVFSFVYCAKLEFEFVVLN
jgi:hypothetical protein